MLALGQPLSKKQVHSIAVTLPGACPRANILTGLLLKFISFYYLLRCYSFTLCKAWAEPCAPQNLDQTIRCGTKCLIYLIESFQVSDPAALRYIEF